MARSIAWALEPAITTSSAISALATSSMLTTEVVSVPVRPQLSRVPPTAQTTASGASELTRSAVTSVSVTTVTPLSSSWRA